MQRHVLDHSPRLVTDSARLRAYLRQDRAAGPQPATLALFRRAQADAPDRAPDRALREFLRIARGKTA